MLAARLRRSFLLFFSNNWTHINFQYGFAFQLCDLGKAFLRLLLGFHPLRFGRPRSRTLTVWSLPLQSWLPVTVCCSVTLTQTFIHHWPVTGARLPPVPAASAGSVPSLILSEWSPGGCEETITWVFVFDSVLLDIKVQEYHFLVLFTDQENIFGRSVTLKSNNYFKALK